MKNKLVYFFVILAIILPNLHYVSTLDYQWYVALSGSLMSGAIFSFICFTYMDTGKAKILMLFASLLFFIFSFEVWATDFGDYKIHMIVADIIIVLVWAIKQIVIIEPESDEYNDANYMFYLSKVNGFITAFNSLRWGIWGLYGGRCLAAGDNVYLVRKNKFQKITYKSFKNSKNLNRYVLIDSGVKVNEKQNKKMDELLEQDFIPLIQDCREFTSGRSLDMILLRKQLSQFLRRK